MLHFGLLNVQTYLIGGHLSITHATHSVVLDDVLFNFISRQRLTHIFHGYKLHYVNCGPNYTNRYDRHRLTFVIVLSRINVPLRNNRIYATIDVNLIRPSAYNVVYFNLNISDYF